MDYSKKRSRESRTAIEKLYISMRQLILRGSYKPHGVSGMALIEALKSLQPEIYGDMHNPEKSELDGLLYVAQRLPKGIEECALIKLVAREGYQEAGYPVIIPAKRRRNCYRVDEDRMYVEMSRGRSDIYDILTHLTFLVIESEKIKTHALDQKNRLSNNWLRLGEVVQAQREGKEYDQRQALAYLTNVLGRTPAETLRAVELFDAAEGVNNLYQFAFGLGQVAVQEYQGHLRREVFFSAQLREVIGHHVYGEGWARDIKEYMQKKGWLERPLHIVSANLHSFVNVLYGFSALRKQEFKDVFALAMASAQKPEMSQEIKEYALQNGLHELPDQWGTNLNVQIIDTAHCEFEDIPYPMAGAKVAQKPLLFIMDYAFGEQAYECMDELLKAHEEEDAYTNLNVQSVSVMGKAGILNGAKGDIMIPSAHVFEGTGDNYPFDNDLSKKDFAKSGIRSVEGTMVTVLGTSLQNRDVLYHFLASTWNAVGIEMEGAHYQKALQSAARIRKSIPREVKVRYAYYASDNPLQTGSTLSSGSLGAEGVKPTYWITLKILEKVFSD